VKPRRRALAPTGADLLKSAARESPAFARDRPPAVAGPTSAGPGLSAPLLPSEGKAPIVAREPMLWAV